MDPGIWVAVAAVFVSGGAIGTAGTLLTQWLLRGLREGPDPRALPEGREVARLRGDVRALVRKVRNLDERLDFQEQLLGGASPTGAPPRRLAETADGELEGEADRDGPGAALEAEEAGGAATGPGAGGAEGSHETGGAHGTEGSLGPGRLQGEAPSG